MKLQFSRSRLGISSILISISFFLIFGIGKSQIILNDMTTFPNRPTAISSKHVMIEYNGKYGNPVVNSNYVTWRYKPYKYGDNYQEPPNNFAGQLFPQLGLYSSHDLSVLRHHCSMLYSIGVDSIILQWYGEDHTDEKEVDENAGYTDTTLSLLLKAANEFHLKILVQIPIYERRSNTSLYEDILYLNTKYFDHPAYLRIDDKPAVIIYDPHTISNLYMAVNQLAEQNNISCYLIASVVEKYHVAVAVEDGFDAIFTYFASEGVSWCSNISNWKALKRDCKARNITFIPAVGPGYNDEKIERWKRTNERSREAGAYYDRMWKAAVKVKTPYVVINSFNNWLEGTEIEPAIERSEFFFTDVLWAGPESSPTYFIERTKHWIDIYKGFKKINATK